MRASQARALREDAASKFREEEKDFVQAVANLRNAIAVLSKHQKTQAGSGSVVACSGGRCKVCSLIACAGLRFPGCREQGGVEAPALCGIRFEHGIPRCMSSAPLSALSEACGSPDSMLGAVAHTGALPRAASGSRCLAGSSFHTRRLLTNSSCLPCGGAGVRRQVIRVGQSGMRQARPLAGQDGARGTKSGCLRRASSEHRAGTLRARSAEQAFRGAGLASEWKARA